MNTHSAARPQARPHHHSRVDDAAPGLIQAAHEDHQHHDAGAQRERRHAARARRAEIADAEEGRQHRAQRRGVEGQVARPRGDAGREAALEAAVALEERHGQHDGGQRGPLARRQRAGHGAPRDGAQPDDRPAEDQRDARHSPRGRPDSHGARLPLVGPARRTRIHSGVRIVSKVAGRGPRSPRRSPTCCGACCASSSARRRSSTCPRASSGTARRTSTLSVTSTAGARPTRWGRRRGRRTRWRRTSCCPGWPAAASWS